MIFITQYGIYLTILLMLILAFKGKLEEKKALILAIFSLPIAIILIKVIHLFYYEPRPFVSLHLTPLIQQSADASFPSRHATVMAVIAFSYIYYKSKWSPVFLLLMILIGISRIYVGVHYPVDVIAGFIVGIISVIIIRFLIIFLKPKYKQHPVS